MNKITQLPDGRVHIEFERTDGTYTLKDAIVVSQAQYDAMTPADIEAIEQKRWDEWIAIVTYVPPEPVPPEGFEFVRDEYGQIVYDENGEPVLVAIEGGE
jgi:hypothetical protein